jgi:DNA repair exonuclease SbcCD ATPase subunit
MGNLTELSKRISQLKGICSDRKKRVKVLEGEVLSLMEKKKDLEEAVDVLLTASRYIHDRLQYRISSIVTKALQTVFDDPYTFKLVFGTRGDKTFEVSFVLERDGEEYDPLTACGGGVVDVLSYALRLSCLLISHPAPDKVLILDEPFRCVSRDLQPRVREVLDNVSKELGVQHIIITHEEGLEA